MENEFSQLLTLLFDVAHADCEHLIRIEEDKRFLLDQRGDRKTIMGKEDLDFKGVEERRLRRKHDELRRKERAKLAKIQSLTSHLNDSHQEDLSSESDNDDEIEISQYHRRRAGAGVSSDSSMNSLTGPNFNKRCLIDNPLFVASLDRTKTTPREAIHIVAPALKAVGINVD